MTLSSRTENILHSHRELSDPIRVHGATPPAQAWLTLKHAEENRTVVVICPDDDAASDFHADLVALSHLLPNEVAERIKLIHFPTWEQSAYSPIAPSIRTRLKRVQGLAALHSLTSGPRILTTTVPALCQTTIPRHQFERLSIRLEIGKEISGRDQLVQRLVDSGYLRVDTVEDPGSFAVRGEIIDLFKPDSARPHRIELFGNEVEKIRFFDPSSQRTDTALTPLRELVVPPAREVVINSETIPGLRERLKSSADDRDVPRSVRDPLLEQIRNASYPDHCDTWAAFAYETPASLWDYLEGTSEVSVIWSDEMSCLQNWDEFFEEQKAAAQDAPTSGLVVPDPSRLFPWKGSLESKIATASRLFLDRVQLADLQSVEKDSEETPAQEAPTSTRHRVVVKTNQSLSKGSRQSLGDLEPHFQLWRKQGFRIVVLASTKSQMERITYLLGDRGIPTGPDIGAVTVLEGMLSEGFRWASEGLIVLTDAEVIGSSPKKRSSSQTRSAAKDWAGLQALTDLSVGDAVVHMDHGIGRYQGLSRLDLSGAPSDFLLLEYANKDKLYLPVYRLNVIQKYAGSGEHAPLDKLGGQQFAKAKDKVREAVKKLAVDLVRLYAERKVRHGPVFSPRDAEFREFEARFPFEETPDQLKAIDDVLGDLEAGRIMDRLVCGDVGYGKTEVAIRAAYRAVSDGKQVAVLVPTTVLAFQHEQNFRTRFKDYPIGIESVSRFKTTKEQKAVIESLATGKLDIVVGTHRLLSKDVSFKDLGLIIVDEEHRFGVEHKERLKTLKLNTPVLTLTATPIPRTLHMALSGLRDISLINTAPVDRLPIRTYVSKYDDALIQKAVRFELGRGGQVFFLHNRVQTIAETAARVKELVPEAQVGIAHGQMGEGELERTMLDFYEKRFNVLVCTTIIESGLDVPTANTILISRADMLGLAQLYQIRGRVGRGQQRAYAYLFVPAEGAITDDAKKRLEVIQKFVELGSGFGIASHDLEIRGGGDILGPQQSGHIATVGFDLYTELLEEAIAELQGRTIEESESREPEIKTPFPAFLSEEYVPDIHQRLSLYRRCSAAKDEAEVDRLEEELADRFGPLPMEAQNLLWLIRIKQLLKRCGIETLTVGPEKASWIPGPRCLLDPTKAVAMAAAEPKNFQLLPDSKMVSRVPTGTLKDLTFALEALMKRLGAPS